MEQDGYAIGDPGTEAGHALGTEDTPRTLTGGSGDVLIFVRIQVYQSQINADINLTKTLKAKADFNAAGYLDIPGPGAGDAANPIEMVDNVNLTQGNDTTERLTAPAMGAFLADNQGQCDTSSTQGASFDWTTDSQEYIEILLSLKCLDAQLSNGDQVLIQLTESDDTALGAYNQTVTINWSEGAAGNPWYAYAQQ
jgi:hypothetical protein